MDQNYLKYYADSMQLVSKLSRHGYEHGYEQMLLDFLLHYVTSQITTISVKKTQKCIFDFPVKLYCKLLYCKSLAIKTAWYFKKVRF